jgi:hypothetical protein
MKGRRHLQGVLCNFLETYTSRYSDYEGWWIFGLLGNDIQQLKIDLLNSQIDNTGNKPLAFAIELAKKKFAEQLDKNRIAIAWIREAHLEIEKLPHQKNGFVNKQSTIGHDFRFAVQATSDCGKIYKTEVIIFIAPHNSNVERQSTRALDV